MDVRCHTHSRSGCSSINRVVAFSAPLDCLLQRARAALGCDFCYPPTRGRISMASPRSPTSSPNSPLLRLPASLLTIILTYLPLPCKFSALTRICHSFPRPAASAFQHDHLELSAECLVWLNTRPHSVALFGQLRSLTFLRNHATALCHYAPLGPQLSRLFSLSPAAAQPFSSLRVLYLSLPDDGLTAMNRTLLAVFASSASSLPLLHTLCIAVTLVQPQAVGMVAPTSTGLLSSWLGNLPSLRHLTLAMWVDVRAMLYLFSLPLLSLDLRDCRVPPVMVMANGSYSDASLETVSGTLRQLYLPSDHSCERVPSIHMAQLLQPYAERSSQPSEEVRQQNVDEEPRETDRSETATKLKWRLEHLRYAAFCPSNTLQFATSISSLISVHISCFNSPEPLNTFFSASPATLPHLSRLIIPVTDVQSRRADEMAISEECLAFFPLFSSQLRHLTLIALSSSSRACQQLFASVLTCTRLVSLKLTSDLAVRRPIALPARIEHMLLLKKLHIRSPAHRSGRPSHLQQSDVVRLLASCPALCDLSLSLPNASINLLSTIARRCPQLCMLTIRSDDTKLWDMSEELAATAEQLLTAALTSLHTLHIDHDLRAGQTAPQPTAALLGALSSLLGRSPIRRLCLLPHLDVTNLHFYASFPQLARLRIHIPPLRTILHYYCRQPDASNRSVPSEADRRVDSWMSRSRGREEDLDGIPDEWLSCPAFVSERVFVESGRALTGREAWLERAQVVAAAETERRRLAALNTARAAAEEEARQTSKEAKRSRKKKAAELSAADGFFAASGIKRKR